MTSRIRGRSLETVAKDLRAYLLGWKQYFQLADTPGVFRQLDEWLRHRLSALQLKQWKRGTTVYRELRARGTHTWPAGSPPTPAAGGGTRACTSMSPCPRVSSTGWEFRDLPANLNLSNRRMRTRLSGSVAGE
ncbi:group II intron maturase-specific domain-containing protein [Archangium violaceum]|uniref:group II intron maturase-specific domain-containing protein n=1 Tax=Archangium violaceum TaxID=83451 RepID=UPI00190F31E6